MPTTRAQEAAEKHNLRSTKPESKAANGAAKPPSKGKPTSSKKPASTRKPASKKDPTTEQDDNPAQAGEKREAEVDMKEKGTTEEPPVKKAKTAQSNEEEAPTKKHPMENAYQAGTIERGHIYFFYRPKVELEEAHSLDDVQRFYMLLIPRPPQFASGSDISTSQENGDEDQEMNLIEPGADAVPEAEPKGATKKRFRLLVLGKKALPDPEATGSGRHQVFWATITTIGEDLKKLEEGLGARTYETKTRGTRHQGSARLAARGAYAIVNSEARTPSQRETHLGFYISHPSGDQLGEVQETLGIHQASSFVLQVKNPLAPPSGPGQVGLPKGRQADFPEEIMRDVFGKGGQRGRESYGLRFASCERREMLDCEGAELLFIAARSGDEGLEQSLGEGRGQALEEVEKSESKETIDQVMKELAMDGSKVPADPLGGGWA
ncbi:hypothetical protein L227DRAFT_591317 [Lentinus tigrinus ALCF2SS1-6]|uniref:Uncharacterized protein n=1 Tax=Lentinus tigrinus ALCF2SS1-6 TaxID=1328759 RepID=A0A5C2SPW8_9APHY|nr:hypothetical protein L227DRAFT_591317 [Lentinus tigrinus ALCF2SS1-6]